MTQDQIDNYFTYHAPTPETAPKYGKITARERNCWISIQQGVYENLGDAALHKLINEECKAFALLIEELVPEGDDKSRAIQHVRLARNAFNEAIKAQHHFPTSSALSHRTLQWFWTIGETELVKARWLANSGIACNGL